MRNRPPRNRQKSSPQNAVPAKPVAPAVASRFGRTSARVSQAPGQALINAGGLGFIPRRGVLGSVVNAITTGVGLELMALTQPMQLLILLADVVPEVARALHNDRMLGCGPGAVTFTAREATADGSGEEVPEGTAALNALFEGLPAEVGGLQGALQQNFEMALFTGMAACEAVPGPRGAGVTSLWPVNTLTVEFRREEDSTLALYQRQCLGLTQNAAQAEAQRQGVGGFVPMPMERFFWAHIPSLPDDPYGRAPYATALNAALGLLSALRDMGIAFHRVGTGRYNVGFDFEAWGKEATEIVGLTDPDEIKQYIADKYATATAAFDALTADDTFFHGAGDKVDVVGGSEAVSSAPKIIAIHLRRLVMSLQQNPALMGVVEGSTETWSADQFRIYAGGLEAARTVAVTPLRKAAALHLRLLGMPYVVHAEMAPIRATQRLLDAQAEKSEIENAARKRDEGWQSQDTSSQEITGSAPVSPTPLIRPTTTQGQVIMPE